MVRPIDLARLVGGLLVCALAPGSCGGDASSSLTLEDVCDVLPKRYCAQDRPCCEKAGFGFDEAHCEEGYRRGCVDGVAAVLSHRAVFHPEKLDACIAGFQPFEDKCRITPAEYVKSLSVAACYQVFEGTVPVDGRCDGLTDCAPQRWPESAYCDTTCKVLHFAEEGDACITDGCGPGLLCDETSHCVADELAHYVVDESLCSTRISGTAGDGGPGLPDSAL